MRFEAAVRGRLKEVMAAELRAAEAAVTAGIRAATRETVLAIRADVEAGGLGRKLANAWRDRTYPAGRRSLEAAGFIWSNAPKLHTAHSEGVTIRGRTGNWLAIPTEAVPRGAGGRRWTVAEAEQRFGRLRFVYRSGKVGLLVADFVGVNARGRVRSLVRRRKDGALAASLKGRTSMILFVLTPLARLRKRFDWKKHAVRADERIVRAVLAAWRDPARR